MKKLRPRQVELLGERGRLDRGLAMQMIGDSVHGLVVGLGQVAQNTALTGDATEQLGADDEDHPRAVEHQLPSA